MSEFATWLGFRMLRGQRRTGASFPPPDWDGEEEGEGDDILDSGSQSRIPFPMRSVSVGGGVGSDGGADSPGGSTTGTGGGDGPTGRLPPRVDDSLLASVAEFEGTELHLHWTTLRSTSGGGWDASAGDSMGGSPNRQPGVTGAGGPASVTRAPGPLPRQPAAVGTTVTPVRATFGPVPEVDAVGDDALGAGLGNPPDHPGHPDHPDPSSTHFPGDASPSKAPSPAAALSSPSRRRRTRRLQRLLPEPDLRTEEEVAVDVAITEARLKQDTIERRVCDAHCPPLPTAPLRFAWR
jgi:hypothetical protein